MAGKFHDWWHAGEEGAIAIYGSDSRVYLVIAGFCFLTAVAMTIIGWWRPVVLLVTLGVIGVSSSRYAIIFTASEFVVRPGFGDATRILYSSITRMTSGYSGKQPAVILQLPFGQTYTLNPDVIDAQQMLQRLQQITGKQIK